MLILRDGKVKIKIIVNIMIIIYRMSGEIILIFFVRIWVRVWFWVGICSWVEIFFCFCLFFLFGLEVIWRLFFLVFLFFF